MLIKRYKGDTYPLVMHVEINREPVDFTTISSMALNFSVDSTIKTITSTNFDNVKSDVTFDVTSDPTIFDEVGVFPAAIVATDNAGYKRTYAVGKLQILDTI